MKGIMIAGPKSNSGKTLLTAGIIRALKKRKIDVSAFKTGSDFIDRGFLAKASMKEAGNLDYHLMGQEGIVASLSMNLGDLAIIEGVMGYFDGIHNTFEGSSFAISKALKIATILVYSPEGEMFSVIPKIKGMVDFPDSQIQAVILNKVTFEMYQLLKEQIEKYTSVKVIGYLPYIPAIDLESSSNIEEAIEEIAHYVEESIDIHAILKMASHLETDPYNYPEKRKIKVAIAYDEAFNHYYNENLKLLEKAADVRYFSLLKDKSLPENDFIYIGSGQLNPYLEELSNNKEMIGSIKKEAFHAKPILAENAGFTYLTSSINDFPMVNIFNASSQLTSRLQLNRFGYLKLQIKEDSIIGKKGTILKGNESHRSTMEINENPIFDVKKVMGNKKWSAGYQYKNTLAYYQHIHFLGSKDAFSYLLDQIEKLKGERE